MAIPSREVDMLRLCGRTQLLCLLLLTAHLGCADPDEPGPTKGVPRSNNAVEMGQNNEASNNRTSNNESSNNTTSNNTTSNNATSTSSTTTSAMGSDSDAQLATFWERYGGREGFPELAREAIEAMIQIEDLVYAGEWAQAREQLDALFARYPLSDTVWWNGVAHQGANVGTPVAYYSLRMLDEIVRVGLEAPGGESLGSLQLTVVLAQCARGQRPTNPQATEGEEVELTLKPEVEAQDHAILRQSLRLFQRYIWAMSDKRLSLEVAFVSVATCAEVEFSKGATFVRAGLKSANAVVGELPEATREVSDMYWVIYPSNVPVGEQFEDVEYVTGGMGAYARAPLFIGDDAWLVRKPYHLGEGAYTDIERRVYLPQWLQHEYYHHLYRSYPEFGLEAQSHQWFDRNTWPADFVGQWEPDYYAESLAKRLRQADPPLIDLLRAADRHRDNSHITRADLLGRYERRPVDNGWHQVEVLEENGRLYWSNASPTRWELSFEDGKLRTPPDSPYGERDVLIEVGLAPADGGDAALRGLRFLDELYHKL